MKLSWFAVAIAAVVSCLNVHAQVTWYVDNNSADNATAGYAPPAGTPGNLIKTVIQDAVDAAANGDTVLVYPGTYTSTNAEVVNLRGKAITLQAAVAYVIGTGSTHAVVDGQDARRCIVATLNEESDTIVRGLVIYRGRASAGGGMYVVNGSPRIEDCWFLSNVATGGVASGGALRLLNSTSMIQDCFFQSNSAGAEGGAIFNAGGAIMVSGCGFTGNLAPRGGGLFTREDASSVNACNFYSTAWVPCCYGTVLGLGIYALDSHLTVNGSSFTGLYLGFAYGAAAGAAMQVIGAGASVRVTACEFLSNSVVSDGRGAAVSIGYPGNNRGSVQIVSCTFRNNSATTDGGAIAMQSIDRLEIDGQGAVPTIFENNSAGRFGGAISVNADWVGAGTFALDDAVFRGNGAGSSGGAIWIRQTDGNGIRAISDASFLTNAAANGGGLYLEGTAALTRLERVAFCGNDPSNIAGLYSAATPDAVCQTISCQDQNGNGFPDTCEFAFEDCNLNNIPDDEELVGNDINNDRVPDDCQPDLTFAGLSTEIVPITAYVNGLPSSAVCWRIYANFRDRPNADPPLSAVNGSVTAVYGNPAHPLSISSAAGFFQALVPNELNQPVHANTAASIPCATTDDAVRYDSFFTVGAECQGQQTSLQTTPLLSFAQFNAPTNSVLSTNDGAIFVQPDSPSSRAGKDRKVLIMQLTTKSAALPVGNINLRGRADIGAAGIWDAFALPIPAPAYSSQSDCNNNGVHDALDIAAGLRDCNYDGVPDICQGAELRNDCDGDGTPDACEIAAGTATDTNGNGLPDNCECYGDVDQNGSVNVDDLLEVFASWGMSGSGIPADVDGNGIVGPGDIAGVLAGWGGCI